MSFSICQFEIDYGVPASVVAALLENGEV